MLTIFRGKHHAEAKSFYKPTVEKWEKRLRKMYETVARVLVELIESSREFMNILFLFDLNMSSVVWEKNRELGW